MTDDIRTYIRNVPDHPKPGILFFDLTTLILDPDGFNKALDRMQAYVESTGATKLVGVESRGFVFGAALADRLNLPLALARKPGKLPAEKIAESFELEYGTDSLELHVDAVSPGDKVVVVDDLIATGGTIAAVCRLVERLGGTVVGISAVVVLTYLPYEEALAGYDLNFLAAYDSEST
jgi:adenine phosphoribosyltransferase